MNARNSRRGVCILLWLTTALAVPVGDTLATELLTNSQISNTELSIPPLGKIPATMKVDPVDARSLTPLGRDVALGFSSRAAAAEISANSKFKSNQSVSISPMLLQLPTDRLVDFSVPATGVGMPRQYAHLKLSLQGEEFVLWVTADYRDARYGYRHVSAAVLNKDSGYALFSVAGSGEIVGTISGNGRIFRIVPFSPKEQGVYQIDSPSEAVTLGKRGVSRSSALLEQRHLQALRAAELQPDRLRTTETKERLHISGGALGRLPVGKLTQGDAVAVLRKLDVFANPEALAGMKVESRRGSVVRLRQYIGQIPVAGRNELELDIGGVVRDVRLNILDPARAPTQGPMPRAKALALAASAYAKNYGRGSEIEFDSVAELTYEAVLGRSALALVYRFHVSNSKSSPSLHVKVDAITGEVTFDSSQWPAEVYVDIYSANENTAPKQGADPGAIPTWTQNSQGTFDCVGGNFTLCLPSLQTSIIAAVVTKAWEQVGNAASPPLCCVQLGGHDPSNTNKPQDDRIELVLNTNGATFVGVYDTWNGSVIFQPGTTIGRNADVVIHELFHHYQHMYGGGGENEPYANAVREGLADSMVGFFAEYYQEGTGPGGTGFDSLTMGERWVMGDGYMGDIRITRDMTRPKQLGDVEATLAADPANYHEASKGISNFFYRLWKKNAMTPQRAMQFIMQVAKNLEDWDADGLSRTDLYEAIESAVKASEPTLLASVKSVWIEMGGTIPTTPNNPNPSPLPPTFPTTGIPGVPVSVSAAYAGCGSGFTWHLVSWSSVWNAGNYQGFLAEPNGVYVNKATFPPTKTSEYAFANYNTSAKMRACNADGCSNLSVSTASMPYNSQCSVNGW